MKKESEIYIKSAKTSKKLKEKGIKSGDFDLIFEIIWNNFFNDMLISFKSLLFNIIIL